MPESKPIFDKFTADSPMNCLRCVHCQQLPYTNWSDAIHESSATGQRRPQRVIIPIRCEKAAMLQRDTPEGQILVKPDGERPAYIWERCPIADGRLHNSTQTHAARAKSGDRAMCITPAEVDFLRRWFFDTSEKLLCAATLREWRDLKRAARRAGLARSPERVLEAIKRGTCAARAKVQAARFNDAQREFIARTFGTDLWPSKGGNANPGIRQRNDNLRAAIVAAVASLGPRFSWDSIMNHAHEQQPGAKRWRKKWEQKHRRKPDGFIEKTYRKEKRHL